MDGYKKQSIIYMHDSRERHLPMPRLCFALLITWAVADGCPSHAQDKALEPAQALQQTLQKTIAAAEPSIACILVSRSDAYLRRNGPKPTADSSGKLGDFDPRNFLEDEKSTEERDVLSPEV